jgi:hypothetical protein
MGLVRKPPTRLHVVVVDGTDDVGVVVVGRRSGPMHLLLLLSAPLAGACFPRWSEVPAYVLAVLARFLGLSVVVVAISVLVVVVAFVVGVGVKLVVVGVFLWALVSMFCVVRASCFVICVPGLVVVSCAILALPPRCCFLIGLVVVVTVVMELLVPFRCPQLARPPGRSQPPCRID